MRRALFFVLTFLSSGLLASEPRPSGSGPLADARGSDKLAQDVTLQGLTDGSFRFKDIGGEPYSQSFTGGYSYVAAHVTISLDTPGLDYLGGAVSATGLKPNFAYQIKLTGNPSKSGMADADDATNEILGYHGRWWRMQPNAGNSDDTDYNANKDAPGYVYEGYILIAFFVTDAMGNANVRFAGNNSFHVLWRVDQRTPAQNDGPPLGVTVPDTSGSSAYDEAIPARQFSLYGEWEPTRALPGTLQLPLGHYRCRMFLTEESFHDTGPLGGQWAVAMSAPLEFDIPTLPQDKPLTITRLRARLNFASPGHDFMRVWGSLELPTGLKLEGFNVQASILGAARGFVLNRFGSCWRRDGLLQLRPSRNGSGGAQFELRVSRATLVLPQDSRHASAIAAPLQLALGGQSYAGSASTRQKRGGRAGTLRYDGE